jgi:hypothetical protein
MSLFIHSATLAVVADGRGRFSLDSWLGWADDVSGLWWRVGVLAVAPPCG